VSAVDEVDKVLEQSQLAGNEFMKGNPKPVKKLWSRLEDVSLANPFGPPVRVGSRLLRSKSAAHPIIETAKSMTSRL
jgi:hypothetical protein